MDRLAELRARALTEPLAQFLGATFDRIDQGFAAVSLAIRPEFLIPEGFVQGGIITTLADYAGVYAAMTMIGKSHTPALELTSRFMRPVTLDDEKLRAVAVVENESKTFVWVSIEVTNGRGKLKAKVSAIFVKPKD